MSSNKQTDALIRRIQELEKLIRDLDRNCFNDEVIGTFKEGVEVDIAEYTKRLTARINAKVR